MSIDTLAPLIEKVRRCAADCVAADATAARARTAQDAARRAHFAAETELNRAVRTLVDSKETP